MVRLVFTTLMFAACSTGMPNVVLAQFNFNYGGGQSGGYNYGNRGSHHYYNGSGGNHNYNNKYGNGGGFQWSIGPNGATSSTYSGRQNYYTPNYQRQYNGQPNNWQWYNGTQSNQQYNNQQYNNQQSQQYTEREPPEVPKNTLPESHELATDPKVNPIDLSGLQMPSDDVEWTKKFFEERLATLVARLEERVPNVQFDESELVGALTRNGVSGEMQIKLLDLLRSGDIEAAEELWQELLPELEALFGRGELWDVFEQIRIALRHRRPVYVECQPLFTRVPTLIAQRNCCSADDLLAQLQEDARIYDALIVDAAQPIVAVGTQQSSAVPRQSATQLSQQSTGTRTANGTALQQVGLPTGVVNIVRHPELPIDKYVVVNSQLMLRGTGGLGSFHVQTGRAAELLGYEVETTTSLPMHNSKLIRSGILLLNETGVKINLVADYEQLAVLSGFQQRIERIDRGTVLISFDSGTGNTVRYTLRPGTFQFKLIDGALDLVQMKFGVTIDNEKNKVPFQYIVQGKYASVAAGHSETHASDFPIVICFDRGNGQATKQVRHLKSNGRLLLAVNASDHFWDLFDADAVGSNRTLPAASPIAGGEANYVPAF